MPWLAPPLAQSAQHLAQSAQHLAQSTKKARRGQHVVLLGQTHGNITKQGKCDKTASGNRGFQN